MEWSERGWKYEIVTGNDNITVLETELIGTGNLQPNTKEKPVFRLGELVEFRLSLDGPPIRIIQGIFKLCRPITKALFLHQSKHQLLFLRLIQSRQTILFR